MSKPKSLSREQTLHVRDTCLCLQAQRAARALARRFDLALRPLGLNNGQFSLMMMLNRAEPRAFRDIAPALAMDRTTLTAKLKPLVRRGLAEVSVDPCDRRGRLVTLTAAGRSLLADAFPVWQRAHASLERETAASVPRFDPARLRADLAALA